MKKQKRVFAVTYWAYVSEELMELMAVFNSYPWSYQNRNAYDVKNELEMNDKRLRIQ